MNDPTYYYQQKNVGSVWPADSPCPPTYKWRVPEWDRLDELTAFLLLAGCELVGDPSDGDFSVYSFLRPVDPVIRRERSKFGDKDPAINIDALHAIYDYLNHKQQEAISDEL